MEGMLPFENFPNPQFMMMVFELKLEKYKMIGN
jgi:hypothetical protein